MWLRLTALQVLLPEREGGSRRGIRRPVFWSWMWGIWGTLLAVPMMMVVKVICDHVEDLQPVADFLSE
jgi:hypothetical protein